MTASFRAENLIPHDEMLGISTMPYTEEEISRTSYRPTIIIGLGGTGYDVIRKLKRRIQAHYGGEKSQIFQYMVIDTAPEKPPAGEVALGPSEYIYLKGFPAAQMIDNLKDTDPLSKWWMFPHKPAYTGNGAGAIRVVGRMVLHRYANAIIKSNLFNKLKSAVDIAGQQGLGQRGIKIYVVCSIAGGTGSGMFLDLAYMARNEVASVISSECFVTGVLVMPSAFISRAKAPVERQRWQANGYAALRELDYINASVKEGRSFTQDYGGGYKIGRAVKGMRPFNIAYLISLFNENNQALNSYDSLTEMISEEMMLEIASPLQGDVNNILDNIQETEIIRDGHPYAYSSFSVASLMYPLPGVASWCGLKFVPPFIHDVLLRPLKDSRTAEEEVKNLIDDLQLREESADQVINSLNKDRHGNELPGVQIEFGNFEGIPDENILDAFQREKEGCLALLANSKIEIEARRKELQDKTPPELRKRISSILQDPERGPAYAEIMIEKIDAKLKAFRSDHMLVEQTQYQNQLAAAEVEQQATQEELEKSIHLSALVPWRKKSIQRAVNNHISALNRYLTAESQGVLRENAVHYYIKMLDTTAELLRQVRDLISGFRSEAQNAEMVAEQARVRLKVTQADFSLVKSIVDERVLLDTYERNKPTYQKDEEKRKLVSDFWQFMQRHFPDWKLGHDELVEGGVAAQAYNYLGEMIGQRLATVPLLDRMKELSKLRPGKKHDYWREEIAERYTQAAPFWNVYVITDVSEIDRNLRRSPNLVGYGENNIEVQWSNEVNASINEEITPVQTKNNQEFVFLKTVHALPLFAVYEAGAELVGSYELLQHEWKNERSDLPVHASSMWEAEVSKRDKALNSQAVSGNAAKSTKSATGQSKKKAPAVKSGAAKPGTTK